jgi:hypothetical protein
MRMNFEEKELVLLAHCLEQWSSAFPQLPGSSDLIDRVKGVLAYMRKCPALIAALEEEMAADEDSESDEAWG